MIVAASQPIALITGAATGIGEAAARALMARNMVVVGTDVDITRGERVFAEFGAPHLFLPLDVRDPAAWVRTVGEIVNRFGRLDFVHLNAGVMSRPKGAPLMDDPLTWFTAEGYAKVMDVNLGGVAHGIKAAIEAPGLSRILITASGAAILPLDLDPYYTASKYGVLGMGLALAPTLEKRGVRLDVLCPGAIGTDLTAPDIRAAIHQEPAAFIGEAVATLATTDERGPVWLAFTEAEGLKRYDVPGLPGLNGALDVTDQA
ncbi:MAG: SDR family oxidoreductase [Rhizorhabdus sp.]|uniref:SDR family oxidoreductase n=1 Tax=Rhizorhabdus sp. TaxID=1968843 RepID=UPI001B5C4D69|nr:SDR family oxidoreductase [Rhizorhabdus sp.]MBP8235109.1 SDR family oxidoreductase [Rhizorhabdus sp.]